MLKSLTNTLLKQSTYFKRQIPIFYIYLSILIYFSNTLNYFSFPMDLLNTPFRAFNSYLSY